jgi:RNA polymerase sigma factor (TIGR02999 family)
VDFARSRRYQKRGGGAQQVSLDDAPLLVWDARHDLVAVDDALKALADVDARKSQVVEMRFFGGLTVEEADALNVSPETLMRDWKVAKAWMRWRACDWAGRSSCRGIRPKQRRPT